jgi:ankyrin repeat protein
LISWWKLWPKARRKRELIRAVFDNDMVRAEQLLYEGACIDALYGGQTLLLAVIMTYQMEAAEQESWVRFLLEHGANPNLLCVVPSDDGEQDQYTPLIVASWKRPASPKILSLLLEHKAAPNLTTEHKTTALSAAVMTGNSDGVKILLAHGAEANTNALVRAAVNGHLDIVKALLEAGADVKGNKALRWAAEGGHTDIVLALLDAGADINEDASVLASAVSRANTDTVWALVERGVDVNAESGNGYLPLELAEERGYVETIRKLRPAEERRYQEIARMLREAGATRSKE